MQELKLHQIELELQIMALRESREQTEAALNLYADLYDSAPVGYVTLALDGTITAVTGVLPAAIAANARGHGLICPESIHKGLRQ